MKKYLSRFTTASICTCEFVLNGVWRHVMIILPVLIFICGTNVSNARISTPKLNMDDCATIGMKIDNGACLPTNPAQGSYGTKGQDFHSHSVVCENCRDEYPPAGTYNVVVWSCPGEKGTVGLCDPSTATKVGMSEPVIYDGRTSALDANTTAFWEDGSALTSDGYVCYTVTNVGDGTHYKTSQEDSWCRGTLPFPVTPASCKFTTAAMNVIFGELERADIQTSAEGGANSRTKSASVACEGFGDVLNVTTNFIYTTKLIGDAKAVSVTGNEDLGVAITYKGKVVSPDESYTDTLSNGNNSIDLGFEVIRDPNVALREIKTGEFSANAVMQITIQ